MFSCDEGNLSPDIELLGFFCPSTHPAPKFQFCVADKRVFPPLRTPRAAYRSMLVLFCAPSGMRHCITLQPVPFLALLFAHIRSSKPSIVDAPPSPSGRFFIALNITVFLPPVSFVVFVGFRSCFFFFFFIFFSLSWWLCLSR